MNYFDNEILKKFFAYNKNLTLYVDGKYLSIANILDIDDNNIGYGIDKDGETHSFYYSDIVKCKVGSYVIDLKTLNDMWNEQSESSDDEDVSEDDNEDITDEDNDEANDDNPSDKNDDEKQFGEQRLRLGDYIINEDKNHAEFKTGGPIIKLNKDYVIYNHYSSRQNKYVQDIINRRYAKKG